MKNFSVKAFATLRCKIAVLPFLIILISNTVSGQLATFPLRTPNAGNNNTPSGQAQVSLTNPNVATGTLISGASMLQNSYNGNGYRVKTQVGGTGVAWATSIDNNFGFDIPIGPKPGFDMNITGITFNVYQPDTDFDLGAASHFTIVPYFQVDNAGPWMPLAAPQIIDLTTVSVNFGAINETFYDTHSYVIRFYVYNTDGAVSAKNDLFRCINMVFSGTTYQPVAQPVTVTTVSATATGKYTGSAVGTYSFNGNQFYLVKQSGFIWSSVSAANLATLDTSAATKTTNGSAGAINSTLTGLSAGTTYWARAYIVTQFGIQYGATMSFTTDAPSPPVVTTDPVTNVLSNKATGGGVIVDSGGLAITAKGMVWNNAGGATLTSNIGKVILNGGSAAFSDFMKQLAPNTSYCYRAFATNSLGTTYGADVCFTTGAPAPVLVAIPGLIDFGPNYFGANPITVSFTLTGLHLTPATGNITINIPPTAGFQISLSSGSGFGFSLSLPYTGGTLPRTPIFVKFPTSAYGTFSGTITPSGGGVAAADADIVLTKGSVIQSPADVTNSGNDFWLGFAYQNKMTQASTTTSKPYLTVYVAAGNQAADVTVETPGIPGGYFQTFTVPANSTHAFTNFPDGAVAGVDARLFATGVSNKGIHVYSTNGAPISVWEYIATTGNSAGGSMIFPTNTWNSNYTVQAYAGKSNNGLPNSTFFVIANEDNTPVTITPSSGITDPGQALVDNPTVLYPANTPFTVTLNKGQVFNAIGVITGSGNAATSSGYDLSGTTVSTTCDRKIAVFGGNGRCMVTTPVQCTEASVSAGSDNMIQQMIPSVAWDYKYFTVPTKTMEYNLFRIYVRNVADTVWVNDETHSIASMLLKTPGAHPGGSFFNGNYTFQAFANSTGGFYALETNNPIEIEGNQPISVTQFITAGDCSVNPTVTGNNGGGDPEMIILTGARQSINNAVVYSPSFQNGASGAGYINVVIPTAGVAGFKLDLATNPTQMVDTGRSSFIAGQQYQAAPLIAIANAFKPYPANPAYSWAKFKVSYPTTHVLSSAVAFNATAYGVAQGESYGFNAGTAVKNLSSYKIAVNPQGTDSSGTVIRTCVNTPIRLKIAFPYNPATVTSIVWNPDDNRVIPNGPLPGSIVSTGTIDVGGRTFYIYESPVQYTFTAATLYNFKVTVFGTFASDCPGEDQQIMFINAGQDILNLAANPTCNNPSVTFTADTIPMVGTNILSWTWDFGQGAPVTTGAISPQTHTYTGAVTAYTVKLTTKNTIGCLSTESLDIDFGGGLTSAFTISKDTVCTNQLVTFTDGSFGSGTSGTPNSWQWNFDPVLFNGQTPPAQSWSTPGIKTIQLTVSTAIGCTKTFKDTVVVEAIPVAAINANPAFVCLGDSAAYSDASTIAIGSIAGWSWSFDDGTTSTLRNPKHKWATSGSHTTTLTVTSAGGCTSTNTATHTINVNPLPVAGFKYDLNCTTRVLNCTDTSNAMGGSITGWLWDFGVTPAVTSTLQNPTYTYAAAGTYIVTLTVTTANGCKSIAVSKTITIAASPVADFTLPGNTCLPNASPVFTNTTSISDGTIAQVTYIWNFGDGTGDLTSPPLPVSPTHVFPSNGIPAPPYTISLTAISNNGCTNTKQKSYNSIYVPPVAVIAPQAEVCVNSTVNFSSAASIAAGSTVTGWNWNFNNEGNSTNQNPSFTFSTAGTKTVILTVTSAAGCTSKPDTILVTVNALPTAGFTDTVNCSTFSVGFTDTSVPNAGTVNNWSWSFGDPGNSTSTVQNPTFVYPASGTYIVKLTVKTDKGCTSSTAFTSNVVIAPRPVPDFVLPGNTCLPNANASFTNSSTISDGTALTYTWNFGDTTGILSGPPNPVNPSHIYSFAANHTVTLTATSINGCTKSISKLYDKVFVQPVAIITAPAGVCLGNAANFSSASSTAAGSTVSGWQWGFGDSPAPGSSTQQNPTYTYTGSGPRVVTLTVTSAAGCTSSTTNQGINVNLSPVASFTYSAIRCKDSVVTFNDASVPNAAGGITEWTWNFGHTGAGGTLTQTTAGPVDHTFVNAQSYTVSLSVKNANGCVSSAAYSKAVVINPNPVSKFKVSDICIPAGLAQFTQQATISSGQVRNWDWNFGVAGAVSVLQNPAYNYTTGGVYQVVLKVTSDSSCAATDTLSVSAFNIPTASFDVTNAAGLCSNLPVSIVNKSVVNGFGTVDKLEVFWDYVNNPTVKTTVNAPVLNDTYTNQYPVFGNQPSKIYRVLIRAYSGNGCSKDTSVDISVLAAPSVQFTQPAPVCQEAPSFNLTTASDIFGLPGTGIYSGAGISNSPSFSPSAAGFGTKSIRYTYTTSNGCTDFKDQQIVVYPTPSISFASSVINILEGDVLKLNPNISNGSTYFWSPSTYLNSATVAAPFGIPTNDITYQLRVTSDKGCVDSVKVDVKVVRNYVVPNTFTPNNDGVHDTWRIENLDNYPDVRVRVFTRSGQLVYESYDYNNNKAWDGKYNGKDLPFGTYYYVIETGGGRKPRTGYVTIIR